MIDFTGIMGLAKYESRLLRRTWKFWILVCLGLLFLVIINLYYAFLHNFFSGYSGTIGLLSAGLVLQIVYSQFITLFAVLLIWFCYDFMSKDSKCRVDGVVHSRPLSTFGLVWGKFLGALIPTFATALILTVVSISLRFIPIFHLPFRFGPYLMHLFVTILPGLAFIIALVFFLTLVTRSRVAAIIIAHAYVIIDLVVFISLGRWIKVQFVPLVDFSGYSLTTFHSDLIGFTGFGLLLLQRGYIIALTLLLLALTAMFYPRLKQADRNSRPVLGTAAAAAVLALGYVGWGLWSGHNDYALREAARAEQQALLDNPQTRVAHYDIDLDMTRSGRITASARMTVRNDGAETQDRLVFVLNSGLDVQSVSGEGGGALDFERGDTTLVVNIPALMPGNETEVDVAYRGDLALNTIFLNSKAEINELKGQARNNVAILGYLPSYVGSRYSVLLPQARWYPSPNVDYGYTYPEKRPDNFATADLRITVPGGQQAVTQGALLGRDDAGGKAVFSYRSEVPVPGLSVNCGEYQVIKGKVGPMQLAFYFSENHAANIEFFNDARDKIRQELEAKLSEIQERTGLEYPYPALSLVEVPGAMRAYSEGWNSPNPLIQPGVVMLKEAGFFSANFERAFKQRTEQAEEAEEEVNAAQIKVEMLKLFFDLDVVSGSLLQNAMPNFWGFRLDPSGPLYPVAGYCLDNYLKESVTGTRPFASIYMMTNFQQVLGQGIQAHFSRNSSWQEAFYDATVNIDKVYKSIKATTLAEMKPEDDPELFYNVMGHKGRGFVVTLREYLGEEPFRALVNGLMQRHQYGQYTMEDLRLLAAEVTDQDVDWLFEQWTHSTDLPGYRIKESEAYRIATEGEAPLYQVRVVLANEEHASGFAILTFETRGDKVERRVRLDGLQTVEVALVVPDEPERLVVDPILARNKEPLTKDFNLPDEPVAAEPFERVAVLETGEAEDELTVIVDDLDPGFSLAGETGGSLLRWRPSKGDDEEDEEPRLEEYVRGIPDQWVNWTRDEAYGLYNHTMKLKGGGEGEFSARWAAKLPRRGRYEVLVYIGVVGKDLRAREDDEKLGSDYAYTIEHEDGPETATFDASGAEIGWNSLGTFYFSPDHEAVVTLSDRADGAVIADAVKFTFADKGATDQ
jgi:ABC-type transport system involved in multi-copper enzyme maturation permease subunit